MSLEADKARAHEAQRILDDPLVQAAFGDLEAAYLSAIRGSPMTAAREREAGYFMLAALDGVKAQFVAHVESGKIAAHMIEEERIARLVGGIPGQTG